MHDYNAINSYDEQREAIITEMVLLGYPRADAEHEAEHAEDIAIMFPDDE